MKAEQKSGHINQGFGDARGASIPGGAHVLQGNGVGQFAGAKDFQAVVVHGDADVFARIRVVAVRYRVD